MKCPDCDRELELRHGFLRLHTRPYRTSNGVAQEICPGSRKYLNP
jgi:hypothetical protein